LGTLYENGKGVPKNEAYAASLYRSACASSDGVGCRNIGELYETGEGVEMDIFQAEYFFQKACELGDNISCPLLE
ncbi:tetratricopeptide repeat protein, partial [Paracoccus sp. SSK6]|uniref:tetratricopeptide repeat protein n=1 Tax=Paracoccus sp. SSK6 TaxID=3143131 RepID=UPI00321AC295